MTEEYYLYAASVQGIQNFIFQTNELKDIVGASEMVERICTETFGSFKGKGEIVVNAAGNVKCIYSDKAECEKAVREFPKTVMEYAPGITISQAVVKIKPDKSDFKEQVEEIERRLHVQRNKPQRSVTLGSMAMMRSRTTGLPAVRTLETEDGTEFLDEGTSMKRKSSTPDDKNYSTLTLAKKFFGNEALTFRSIALDIKDLTDKNDWIAVIHADGNNLGQIVAQKNKNATALKTFSDKLNASTIKAAQQAFEEIVKAHDYNATGKVLPFRPVVLGGDDMTVICRASLAMRFVTAYIRHFEENTKNVMGKDDALTACAGIAYMKSSYPFHYGYKLAEQLCEEAKKDAKQEEHKRTDGKAPSCLMFHKIQGSYISSFSQIEHNELTIDSEHSLKFGPYYLDKIEGRWTIDELRNNVARLNDQGNDGNTAKTDIRQWLTLMHENKDYAEQKKNRVESIATEYNKDTFMKATKDSLRDKVHVYPAFDMLQLFTVENQITKEKNDEEH